MMSIDSLTAAAKAAGYAMAASEDLLGDELPGSSRGTLPTPRPAIAQSERRAAVPSSHVVKPKMQPAFIDWVAFWRVPA
jgi:hypothetical protein